MTSSRALDRLVPATIAFAATLLLAACGSDPGAVRPQAASYGWAGQGQVKEAIQLLNAGKTLEARTILIKVLKKQPGDTIARKLVSQIDTPPEQLLGSKSFTRTAGKGESFSQLADRYLGDPLMAFALARYNGIDVPESLKEGQKLRIPGDDPAARTAKAVAESAQPATKAVAAAMNKPKAAPAKIVNPAQASKLRARGLEQLNRGAINSAVTLLAQASQLDPSNPLITRDLNRARRIQKTVKP